MAKKRGGIAGFYDRNKGLVRAGATIGATLLGGPAAGAATGAAFRGLDRPGKRGIGFDPLQGAIGAAEGYGLGKGTLAAKGLLTGAGAASLPPAQMSVGMTPGMTAGMNVPISTGTGVSGGGGLGAKASSLFNLLTGKDGKSLGSSELLGGIAKGLYSERQAGREAALEREKIAENRRQFDVSAGLKEREAAIAMAQEADRKRREDELMAARARIRAMFGGA